MTRKKILSSISIAVCVATFAASAIAFAAQSSGPVKPKPKKWTQCAQHCGSFDDACACFIVVGGTCYVKLAEPGSCVGVECFDTYGHECGD